MSESTDTERRTARGHLHAEAFSLMWYACSCGHQERYWNSRDGVTPFGSACPSCGEPDLRHVRWKEDVYAPDHKPHHGQRVWVDMTRERAEQYARGRIASARAHGHEIGEDRFESIVLNIMGEHGGAAPDVVVTGYALGETTRVRSSLPNEQAMREPYVGVRMPQPKPEFEFSDERICEVSIGALHYGVDEETFDALTAMSHDDVWKWFEQKSGVSRALIEEHSVAEGRLDCAALTKAGHRCRNHVPGFRGETGWQGEDGLHRWIAARGAFCSIHADRTMNVERAT